MSYLDTVKKRDFAEPASYLKIARKRAQSLADDRNEPTYLMEGKNEFFVSTDTDWRYPEWGRNNWPEWAKTAIAKKEQAVIETFFPKDFLKGQHKNAEKRVGKMLKALELIRFEHNFHLDQLHKDYPDVRRSLNTVKSGAEHLYTLLLDLQHEVDAAARDNKKNGKPEIHGPPSGPMVTPE